MKLIEGVQVQPLKNILDERGSITEIFTENQGAFFSPPRHIYVSRVYAGATKAWHFHKIQTDHFTNLYGQLKLVLFDTRPDSTTEEMVNEFFLGFDNPMTVKIPPGILHGFKGVEGDTAYCIVVNSCSHPYDYKTPDEYRVHPHDPEQQKLDFQRLGLPFQSVPYDWQRKDG